MDDGVLFLALPIVGILAGTAANIFKRWSKHEQAMALIRSQGKAGVSQDSLSEVAALRRELAELRETAMQFDMSVDKSLEEVQHRLSRIEQNARSSYAEPQQTITNRQS